MMEKGDFKSWKEAVEFYKEEYKDIILQEFLFRMEMKWENGEYEDIQTFLNDLEKGVKPHTTSRRTRNTNLGGRPKGTTKRTINRYKKVFHQFVILKKKYSSKTKAELYELLASQDYDGKTYTRKTIRNIIEDKKYNLVPSR